MRWPDSSPTILGPRQKKTVWRYGSASHWQWKNDANQCGPCMFPVTFSPFSSDLPQDVWKWSYFSGNSKNHPSVFNGKKGVPWVLRCSGLAFGARPWGGIRLGGWNQQAAWVFLIDIFCEIPHFWNMVDNGSCVGDGPFLFTGRTWCSQGPSHRGSAGSRRPSRHWGVVSPQGRWQSFFPETVGRLEEPLRILPFLFQLLTCWLGVTSNS